MVILKADGLPERLVEEYAHEPAGQGRDGHTRLPWIEYVFGQNGTWLENFYVRGLSLSAPSWSLLDTGRPLEIRANAEYDRYTLRVHDYLNLFPFYVGYATSRHVDMAGVELLDDRKIPLLIDRFPEEQQFQGFQLYQRGVRWATLEDSLKHGLGRRPKELFDEWQTGFTLSHSVNDQTERELIEKLKDPQVRYLDFFTGDYDHIAHLTADRVSQLHAIENLDSLVGRIWAAIQQSPRASTTALVLLSDHGMNTEPGVYSQGYDLLGWFGSAAGGGHHVLTNRHPMTEFKLRGLDPFVSEVITPSRDSAYLSGQTQYPTAVLELDGNEKAAVGLRNNTLNVLQILLDQLTHKKLAGNLRAAALNAFFSTLDAVRPAWQRDLQQLSSELQDLDVQLKAEAPVAKKTADKAERRRAVRMEMLRTEAAAYDRYGFVIAKLLRLSSADFDPGKFKIEELIPARSLGPPNSIRDLQHYVVGPAAGGLILAEDGTLDMERSFRTVDYFRALGAIAVRNNVQASVDSKPVDFIAAAMPDAASVWLWGGEDRQALIQTRRPPAGPREIRYLPVARLTMDPAGEVHYDRVEWGPGFPLHLYEELPDKREWLSGWHTEREWLENVHRTKYSNGIIGLTEEMLAAPAADPYLERKRRLLRADFLVLARDHWNFNVRGFNPGGNHGSFLRVSTNSVLLIAGGNRTGIPRGLRVDTPYDSLSFVPTILTLLGRPEPDLPGPVIREVVP